MFDIVAKLLCSVATFPFPVFASYKALQANNPAQLTPWLMYWVVLACGLFFESWTDWILVWIPFYHWIRLSILLYLVLPQTQGAKSIYLEFLNPFLREHEAEIESFISRSHDQLRAAGWQYLQQLIRYVKETLLGMDTRRPPTPPQSVAQSTATYAQTLLSRFNLPAPAAPAAPAASDIYSFLSSALQTQMAGGGAGGTREPTVEQLSASGTLIPPNMQTKEEKMSYIASQRERLRVVLQALDREALNLSNPFASLSSAAPAAELDTAGPSGGKDEGLKKSKSELDFERVEKDDEFEERSKVQRTTSGGWMPWNWSEKQTASAAKLPPVEQKSIPISAPKGGEASSEKGVSTGVDTGSTPL